MTLHPPSFAAQKEEQAKWETGFKAGVLEVVNLLEEQAKKTPADLEGPTPEWTREFSTKVSNRYL